MERSRNACSPSRRPRISDQQGPGRSAIVRTRELRPPARIALFLALAAVALLGYLFLLSALRSKLGSFSAAVPAVVIAILTLILNWRFLRSEGRSLAELGFDAPQRRIQQIAFGLIGGGLTAGAWVLGLWAITPISWRIAPTFNSVAAIGSFAFIVFNNAGEELVY